MPREEIDHTETLPEEEVLQTTPEQEEPESVENYSDKLESAETEEDAIAAFNEEVAVETPVEEPTATEPTEQEEATAPEGDTEPETTSEYIFDLRDGDIELSLNLTDEKESKQAKMLMQQGLNYAKKTTELAKYKSFVGYAEEHGITLEDIQRMADAKGGSKEAIVDIAKSANVDIFDLDNDMAQDYQPKQPDLSQHVPQDPMLDTVANEILANEEHRTAFQKWFPTMPEEIQAQVTGNSQILQGVQEDLDAGVFAPAMEQAYKYQRINGMDFGSAYTRAKQEYVALNQPQIRTVQDTPREEIQRASAPRGGGSANTSNRGYAPGVISDLEDDEFLKNYNDIVRAVQANR